MTRWETQVFEQHNLIHLEKCVNEIISLNESCELLRGARLTISTFLTFQALRWNLSVPHRPPTPLKISSIKMQCRKLNSIYCFLECRGLGQFLDEKRKIKTMKNPINFLKNTKIFILMSRPNALSIHPFHNARFISYSSVVSAKLTFN